MFCRLLKELILEICELLSNRLDARSAFFGCRTCICCSRLGSFDGGVFLADRLFLLPSGEGIGELLRMLRHAFLIERLDVRGIGFVLQMLGLPVCFQLPAVNAMLNGMGAEFGHLC